MAFLPKDSEMVNLVISFACSEKRSSYHECLTPPIRTKAMNPTPADVFSENRKIHNLYAQNHDRVASHIAKPACKALFAAPDEGLRGRDPSA